VSPRRARAALALLVGAVACGDDAARPPAAVVSGSRPETALATVTLAPEAEERLGIRIAPVELRAVPRTRVVGGECMAPPGRAVAVTAPFAGLLLAPDDAGLPGVGSALAQGQPVLRLVPLLAAEGDLRVVAQRDVATARARVEVTRAQWQRTEQLLAVGAMSQQAADLVREQLEVAEAALVAARAQAARVGSAPLEESGGIVLTAPHAAVLQALRASPGQTVAAGAPLFDVVGVDPLWVRVPLYVGDLGEVDASAPARVSSLGGDGPPREGRRVPGPLSADPIASSGDLYFELANSHAELRPGERVRVALSLGGRRQALAAPWSAVLYDLHGDTWVYENPAPHVFSRRRVEVRDVVGEWAVLERGPAPGTPVVVAGAAELFGTEFGVGK
jgi:RND family efflux transporter MFP subunit